MTATMPIPEIDQALLALVPDDINDAISKYIHEAGEYALAPRRTDGRAFTAAGVHLRMLIGALVRERDECKVRIAAYRKAQDEADFEAAAEDAARLASCNRNRFVIPPT